jgi:hypothetical protein
MYKAYRRKPAIGQGQRAAQLLSLFAYTGAVSSRVCLVSFTDSAGVQHSVEVAAGSLYEAAVLALADFRRDPLVEIEPGPCTRLKVAVKAPSTEHEVSVQTEFMNIQRH